MSWGAVDDRFHSHRKVLRLRRSPHYAGAITLWTLALSWCCAQEQERFTGVVPLDVVATFGIPDWAEAVEALVEVGLWETVDADHVHFHDWDEWNGAAGKELRSKEQGRLRKQAQRLRDCRDGKHSKDCPTEIDGKPWTCPRRASRQGRHGASRDAGSGRAGSGRDGGTNAGPSCEKCGDRPAQRGFRLCGQCA